MEIKPSAPRGFPRIDFVDHYDHESSMQLSSLADERCIWLGINTPKVMILPKPGSDQRGWQELPLPAGALCSGRMHLTQDQVKALLPFLQQFAKTGDFTPY